MRQALLVLAFASTISPSAAADRFEGYYNKSCGSLVCELQMHSTAGGYDLEWLAVGTGYGDQPVCRWSTRVAIGAFTWQGQTATNVLVGKIDGKDVLVADLVPGERMQLHVGHRTCQAVDEDGTYEIFGDE